MSTDNTKLAWEAPRLRSEQVQETLAAPACRIKIDATIRDEKTGKGARVRVDTAFS